MADHQSDLTNRMLHRYRELTEAGEHNVHTIFAALATVVREHDATQQVQIRRDAERAAFEAYLRVSVRMVQPRADEPHAPSRWCSHCTEGS